MLQVGFEFQKSDILKNLYTFVDIVSEFNLYDIIILSNVKVYFDDEKLLEFYKYCYYKKVKILLVEPFNGRKILEYERKFVIDENYDDFLVKM